MAARLSENAAARVLLLEAGGTDDHADVRDPVKWPTLFPGPLDWGYTTTPMRHCLERVDHVPRARDSRRLPQPQRQRVGARPSCRLRPLGRARQCRVELGRGPDGFSESKTGTGRRMCAAASAGQCAWRQACPNAVATAFVRSGPAVGLPTVADYNSGSMEGTSFFNFTIKDGSRFSVVQAYIQPALTRANITVLTATSFFTAW